MGQLAQGMGSANASGVVGNVMNAVGQGLRAGGSETSDQQPTGSSMLNALQQPNEINDKKDLRNQMLLQALQQLSR